MENRDGIVTFWGWRDAFSNFHPCALRVRGTRFGCSEAAFMWLKALEFGDDEVAAEIALRAGGDAKRAKALGRKVRGYDDAAWSAVRRERMLEVLRAKFADPSLRAALLATGGAQIVEASPYDRIWGAGIDAAAVRAGAPWKGANLLGGCLEQLRDELAREA